MTVMKFCKFFCGMFLGLMLLVTANQAEAMNPQGHFDFVQSNIPNQIRVRGWAFDRDNVNHKVRIHVYVGGSVGANVPSYEIRADQFRPDVNRAFPGVGDYHGFDSTINVDTSRTGNQAIYIYALNDVGSGTFVELGSKPVSIKTASSNRVTNHNPQGRVFQVDSPSNNTLHVKGTAWDDDNPSGTVRVHVYVGGTPGSNVPQYEIRADRANHEFEDTRNIGNSKTGNQTVHVYALNDYGPGTFQEIWTGNVNIKGEEYTFRNVNLTGTRQVVDVFNGVESIYNKNYTAPGDSTYNCAALVKKYYQKIYGVEPYNLLPNKRPMVNGRTLQKVSNPQVGDIAGITTSKVNGHWAIVKAVVGNQVVLFEQNWKANGKTKVNRRINISGVNFYRL